MNSLGNYRCFQYIECIWYPQHCFYIDIVQHYCIEDIQSLLCYIHMLQFMSCHKMFREVKYIYINISLFHCICPCPYVELTWKSHIYLQKLLNCRTLNCKFLNQPNGHIRTRTSVKCPCLHTGAVWKGTNSIIIDAFFTMGTTNIFFTRTSSTIDIALRRCGAFCVASTF